MTLPERDHASLLATYTRLPMDIERGEGVYLIDTEGKRYLDFFGGLAVNALGYAHPAILEAIGTQAARYIHVSNLFPQRPQIELAERVRALSGYDKLFFANSGAEVMEAAFKLVRRWASIRRRKRILSFTGSFHGRTYAGMSLMDAPKYRDGFGPFLEGCEHLPFNDAAALEAATGRDVAAVVLEFIQGEGGIVPATDEFVETLFRLRDEHGFLIVADEIQAGMGRTGRFLSFEHWGVQPDIVTMAKSLGGGLPLGALLVKGELTDVFDPGSHGSTFGGNPVACAAGREVVDALRDGLMKHAAQIGNMLMEGLRALAAEHPGLITEIRGRGCMVGIECTRDMRVAMGLCLEEGLLINVTRERVIRLLPPLIIEKQHVETALGILSNILQHKQFRS
ncbi:MAG: acetylornithine/succinylornithine family transaminase [Bacteroidia bacterium]|nr:acetylornithine/succinylornithine family transaminase [Bacteroidia bacterium]